MRVFGICNVKSVLQKYPVGLRNIRLNKDVLRRDSGNLFTINVHTYQTKFKQQRRCFWTEDIMHMAVADKCEDIKQDHVIKSLFPSMMTLQYLSKNSRTATLKEQREKFTVKSHSLAFCGP